MSELNKSIKERDCQESLSGKYEVLRGMYSESIEKEWGKFRDIVKESTNDVCSVRRASGQRRKGSEWWNEDVGVAMTEKIKALGIYDGYRTQRTVVKQAVEKNGKLAMGRATGGMNWRVTKNVLETGKASEEGGACKGRDGKGCELSNIAG